MDESKTTNELLLEILKEIQRTNELLFSILDDATFRTNRELGR
jgi:hypothetical protein